MFYIIVIAVILLIFVDGIEINIGEKRDTRKNFGYQENGRECWKDVQEGLCLVNQHQTGCTAAMCGRCELNYINKDEFYAKYPEWENKALVYAEAEELYITKYKGQ